MWRYSVLPPSGRCEQCGTQHLVICTRRGVAWNLLIYLGTLSSNSGGPVAGYLGTHSGYPDRRVPHAFAGPVIIQRAGRQDGLLHPQLALNPWTEVAARSTQHAGALITRAKPSSVSRESASGVQGAVLPLLLTSTPAKDPAVQRDLLVVPWEHRHHSHLLSSCV